MVDPTLGVADQHERHRELLESLNVRHAAIVPLKAPAQSYSQGFGGISLIDKAPHPNAAKVFINWILTREIQTELDQAVKINSRRKGVPPGEPHNVVDTSRLDQYFGHQTEAFNPFHERVAAIVREMPR